MSKTYKVKWLRRALKDIENLVAYNPDAVQSAARIIWDASQTLAEFPNRARAGRVPNTRELVLAKQSYLIVFRIKSERVEILRVIHTARKWP